MKEVSGNGRLIMPVALHETLEGEEFNEKGRLFTYFSDDNGMNWQSGKEVRNPKNSTLQESGPVSLKNGKLMMIRCCLAIVLETGQKVRACPLLNQPCWTWLGFMETMVLCGQVGPELWSEST